MGKQCKDCKWLDMSKKTSVGYPCKNTNRLTYGGKLSHLKAPTTPACKTGFEPKEVQMGRLTKADIESIKNTLEKLRTETMDTHGRISLIDDENIYEAINAVEKLAHYEDLEEQNRLIELPCAVGDTVYRTILDKVYEYTVGSFLVDENGAWGMSLLFEQGEKKFAANMDCDNLGKTVFLTKEEAEAKMEELKGE